MSLRRFRLNANCIFLAKNIDDCLEKISNHFLIRDDYTKDKYLVAGSIVIEPQNDEN